MTCKFGKFTGRSIVILLNYFEKIIILKKNFPLKKLFIYRVQHCQSVIKQHSYVDKKHEKSCLTSTKKNYIREHIYIAKRTIPHLIKQTLKQTICGECLSFIHKTISQTNELMFNYNETLLKLITEPLQYYFCSSMEKASK